MTTVERISRALKMALVGVIAALWMAGNAAAQTMSDPLPYVNENFNATTKSQLSDAGWVFGALSMISWQNSGGVNNSGCLQGQAFASLSAMSVVTPYVAMGAKPMVSFAFAAKGSSNSDSIVTWEVHVATVDGTTATWNSNIYSDNLKFTNSANGSGFMSVAVDLSALCANRIAKVQITFAINTKVSKSNILDCFLDNVVIRSDAVIFNVGSGGMVSPAYSLVGADGKLSLSSLPTPTKPNYTFVGWFTAGGSPVTIESTFSQGDVIYAHWKVANPTFIYEEFNGTATPTGWTYTRFSRQTSGGYNNSAALRANLGGEITIPNVAIGDGGGVLSFYFKTAVINNGESGSYYRPQLAVSTNGASWTNVSLTEPSTANNGYYSANLSSLANQIVSMRISVADGTNAYIYIDNITFVGARNTITFDANGGTVWPMTGMTGNTGASMRKLESLPTPTRDGYAFNGWFTSATGGTQVTASTDFGTDATIYAQWTPAYTVTFDANGGAVTTVFGTTGAGGKLASLPSPARSGYTFNGWFTAETGGTQVTTNTVFSGDATIYARWTLITYTVTFNANSGSVTPTSGTTGEGGTLASLPTPTKDGYTFDGWFTASIGGTEVTTNRVYSANTTVYAQWTLITYTVTFDAGGGAVATESGITGVGGKLASLPTPARTGYIFNGWFTEEAGGTQVTTSTVFSENVSIYAQWTLSEHPAVTFDANGGTVAPAYGTIGDDGRLASLPEPTARTGYAFDGWFTAVDGGTRVTTSTVFSGSATIYARWAVSAYAVTFSVGANGVLAATVDGVPIATGAKAQHGKDVVFIATPDDGYEVGGWTLNGAVVAVGDAVYTLNGVAGEVTVTVSFIDATSILASGREIPRTSPVDGAAAVSPAVAATGGIAVGPNPASRSAGAVSIYRNGGKPVKGTLTVFDAVGNKVAKINIVKTGTKKIGEWDVSGVADGAYLIKGVLTDENGGRVRVLTVVVVVRTR